MMQNTAAQREAAEEDEDHKDTTFTSGEGSFTGGLDIGDVEHEAALGVGPGGAGHSAIMIGDYNRNRSVIMTQLGLITVLIALKYLTQFTKYKFKGPQMKIFGALIVC